MNKDSAVKVLAEAAILAQGRGAYTLKEASVISTAVELISDKDKNIMMNEEATVNTGPVNENVEAVENKEEVIAQGEISPEVVAVDEGPEEDAGEAESAPSEQTA